MRRWTRSTCAAALLALTSILADGCASDSDGAPVSIKLRDSTVEGGNPVFVTFELGDQQNAQTVNISAGIVLRRDGNELNMLVARAPGLENHAPVNPPNTVVPTGTLTAGTEYRFELPDVEPGFHELCGKYVIGETAGEVCTELALT